MFERLAVYQQEGFQDNVEEVLAGPYPADAVAQIEAQLERVGWRYVQGHITDDEYRSKWEHLQERRRKVLAAMESVESLVPLDGILDTWNQGDAQARRELLRTLFDELDVRDGEIVGYKPRTDQGRSGRLTRPDPQRLVGVLACDHVSLLLNGRLTSLPSPPPTNRS